MCVMQASAVTPLRNSAMVRMSLTRREWLKQKKKQNKTSAGFRLNYARVTKGCLWGWPKIGAYKGNDFLKAQGHPATVRGSKYCLEISKALEKLKTSGQPFLSSKKFGGFPTV